VLTEQHGLYTRMSGDEYLDFFGQVYRLDPKARKARSQTLLDYFGLQEAAGRRIGEYSKGMRQKLALARAMMHEPGVLLLDEPTSAMDPESARLVRDEIARLKSSKRTIVICTHNLVEAEALADVIAMIYRGRILMQGSLDELKARVLGAPEYEMKFAHPWDAGKMEMPSGVTLAEKTATSLKVRVERPQESNPKLLHALSSRSAPLVSFQEEPRTLEQVYLKVMADVKGNVYVG
jgi:ABC-2 type transport system ATP-binding protein